MLIPELDSVVAFKRLSLGITLFPALPQASLSDLLRLLLVIGLFVAPFVVIHQLRRRRVRRFMARVRERDQAEP